MPRFYFHVRSSKGLSEDPEGEELSGLPEAQKMAVAAIREIVGEMVTAGQGVNGQEMVIADHTGRALMSVPFSQAIKPD